MSRIICVDLSKPHGIKRMVHPSFYLIGEYYDEIEGEFIILYGKDTNSFFRYELNRWDLTKNVKYFICTEKKINPKFDYDLILKHRTYTHMCELNDKQMQKFEQLHPEFFI